MRYGITVPVTLLLKYGVPTHNYPVRMKTLCSKDSDHSQKLPT